MYEPFLGAPGEMGRRIREFDWMGTLGPPSAWPVTLKAMVRLALTTHHPIFIFWGPEHICLYNDAYSASLGPEKHPGILGARGRDAWPEIWDVIGPQIDLVMRGEGATWHENHLLPILRHGGLDDVYWTYSYGPIEEESAPAGVGGVLVICTETTQQVTAAQQLATERARLARLFGQAPGFMAMLSGPHHRFELANPAFLRLVGRPDVLGRTVVEAVPEAAEQGFIGLLDEVYRSGAAYTATGVSYRAMRANRSWNERFIDFVYQPITDETGRVVGIFVEGADVTERIHAEAALRRSEANLREREEQLRLATDAGDVGLWDVDLVSDTLYWAPRVKAMFGMSAEAPVSLDDFYACLHPEDLERTKAAFNAAMNPEQRPSYDVEYRAVGKEDHRTRWIAAKGRGIFDDEGRCRRVIGTAIDITARKAAEARLRDLNEELERQVAEALADRRILADIVEGTDAFVQVADLQFRWLAINRASANEFERIYGVRPKVGDNMLDLLRAYPQHQADVAAVWGRALAGEEFTAVGVFGNAERDRRHYEMKFNSLRDKDGTRVGAFQFVYDVTDRMRGQERLAKAEDALRQAQKMEAVGQLTGGIAHDFNNVLQAIQGSLQLIKRVPSDRRVGNWAETALKSIKRGAELTSQLLTFARQQQLAPTPVSAVELVANMKDMLKRSLGSLVRLEMDLQSAAEATVTVDRTQLEMAILNLSINARDAMPEGGTLTIGTRDRRIDDELPLVPGDYLEFWVRDNGTGMPPEDVERAFDPFFTTKGVGKGTGLGLSQVYGMAKQAGGGAFLCSELGRGTTVSILLPRSSESIAPSQAEPSMAAAVEKAQPHSRILVVDDDDEVRSTVVACLEVLGHEVIGAADGPSALRWLDTDAPDILIVDFAMPGMNGAEVAHHARERFPELPIIFISGFADTAAIERTAGPAATILHKPFHIEQMRATVDAMLERRRGTDPVPG